MNHRRHPPTNPPYPRPSVLHLARLTAAAALEALAALVAPPLSSDDVERADSIEGSLEGIEIPSRVLPLPFPNDLQPIAAGGSGHVELRPQMPFRPDQVLLENPDQWQVDEIYIGNKPQFVGNGGMPASVLADPKARGLKMSLLITGQTMTLKLTNRGMTPATPAGCVMGSSYDMGGEIYGARFEG